MAVRPKKYSDKQGTIISGVTVTEKNFQQAANWAKGKAVLTSAGKHGTRFDDPRVQVPTPRGIRVARVGDLIYKVPGYEGFYVLKAAEVPEYFNLLS